MVNKTSSCTTKWKPDLKCIKPKYHSCATLSWPVPLPWRGIPHYCSLVLSANRPCSCCVLRNSSSATGQIIGFQLISSRLLFPIIAVRVFCFGGGGGSSCNLASLSYSTPALSFLQTHCKLQHEGKGARPVRMFEEEWNKYGKKKLPANLRGTSEKHSP